MTQPLRWALIGASDIAATRLLHFAHQFRGDPGQRGHLAHGGAGGSPIGLSSEFDGGKSAAFGAANRHHRLGSRGCLEPVLRGDFARLADSTRITAMTVVPSVLITRGSGEILPPH